MAGTVSFKVANVTPDKSARTVTINFTADASAGTVPDTSTANVPVPSSFSKGRTPPGNTCSLTEALLGYAFIAAKVTGGTTKPANGGGVTLVDSDGLDWLGGFLSALTSWTAQGMNIQKTQMPVDRDLTLKFNATASPVNSASATIVLYLQSVESVPS